MTSASRVQTVFVTALLVGLLASLAALAALGVLGAEVGAGVLTAFALAALVGLRGLRGEAVPVAPAPRAEAAPFRLLASSAEPHLLIAADGKVVDGNEAAAALVGVPHASLAGASFAGWFADPESATVALERTRARGAIRGVALTLQRASGEARGLLFSGSLAPADDGTAPHALVGLRDVSESRSAAADAEKRLAYTRSLVEASAEPLLVLDVDGTITDVTDAAVVRFGLPRERLVGSEFGALFADADAARRVHERTLTEGRVSDVGLTLRSRVAGLVEVMFSGRAYRDEGGVLRGVSAAIRDVTATRKAERERDAKEWMVAGVGRLNEVFQGQVNTRDLTRRIISELAEYTGAQVGAFYAVDPDGEADALSLIASHAYTHRKTLATRFRPGEGVVGQAALEKKQILLSDVPEDYIRVASGLGEATPRHLCVTPLMLEGRVTGMLELASLGPFTDAAIDYLRQVAPSVAVSLEAAVARERVGVALQRAQTLAAELEAQQDTLRNTNAELEEQTAQLKVSEQKFKSQQAEIELANIELTQKNDLLERQKVETEQARRVLAAQAEEVALASKYKSEFLANMSHELRTPLNSLLLLARLLRENATENLTAEQVESATVIYESGSDLLSLINEILDLSKIEAGKMELRLEAVELADLERSLLSQFAHMASAQGLKLVIERAPDAPAEIVSDAQRVGQVLKNLIGNALKFTEAGGVTVRIGRPDPDARLARSGLDPAASLAISVTDTGIGIPADKQRIIFEAFQQADSGDRRKYGGTGLGLSISRELAALLGGEIQLVSEPGKGSTFTVFLPLRVEGPVSVSRGPARAPAPAPMLPRVDAFAAPQPAAPKPAPARQALPDDRASIAEHDHVILVVEDDERFARILAAHVRARGLKCLLATSGEEGLELARAHRPDGVVLDIQLPQMDGWAVLNTLKQDVSLRHIPVHIVSAEESSTQNLRLGAIGHVAKPVGREQIDEVLQRLEAASAQAPKRVLVVEDDDVMRRETVRIVGNGNVSVTEVSTGGAALAALAEGPFQLVVMDLGLPDMQGLELLRRITEAKIALPPVIIHTNRELTTEEELFLRAYAESIIVKDVRSQERLIDEVALFLHRVVRDLPEENRRAILHLHESNEPLRGKKVLIVEDDMRTMFAMARMLAGHGVNPVKAENGERALAMLGEHPDVDLVLMDMMMPVLDGYEAMQRIRKIGPFARLPIVALTAKAMKEDRQRCLEAGATDYLSKPVDPDRLVSLMRVLLSR